jgi:iron complex outermembrane receptor protein
VYDAWGATLANNFQSGYNEPCRFDSEGNPLDSSGCTTRRVGAYSVWDIQGRYTAYRNLTLSVGIRNFMNTAPPLSNQGNNFQVGIDPSYGDPRGAMFYGAVRYAFN